MDPILEQPFQMKLDRFPDQLLRLGQRLSDRDATRKVWDVCPESTLAPLNDDCVSHISISSQLA